MFTYSKQQRRYSRRTQVELVADSRCGVIKVSLQDPIADMFTRIRNGQMANKQTVSMSTSKLKVAIAKVLQEEGYITDHKLGTENGHKILLIELKYYQSKPVIDSIKRVSRPGLRRYRSKSDIPEVLGGLGITILSTSKGVVTGKKARQIGVGGELIGTVA